MIYWHGKARKERDDDTCSPRGAIVVCPDNSVDERIADFVLNGHIINHRTGAYDLSCCDLRGKTETYEVMKNWFSMYTKCSDSWMAEKNNSSIHRFTKDGGMHSG
jgi:hypothetical protein